MIQFKVTHFLTLLLLLCNYTSRVNCILQCCEEPNVVVNRTMCYDGSNITVLTCQETILIGPTMKYPETIAIDIEDNLEISNEEYIGYIIVESGKYCMTKDLENDSDLALVCYENIIKPTSSDVTFLWINVISAFISVVFLLMVLIVYIFIPDLRDIEGMCILNFLAGLCVEHLTVMLLPMTVTFGSTLCDTNAFIYCASAMFCYIWLSILSFHMWKMTIRPLFKTTINWFLIYCCYGYGVPTLLILTAVSFHYSLDSTLQTVPDFDCFLYGSTAVWSYFYGPLLIILLVIIVPISWTAKKLWMDIDRRDNSQSIVRLRTKCRMYGHLIFVIGTAIIIDTLSYIFYDKNEGLNVLLDILEFRNLLIGGVVFFIFVVLRNKVLIALSKRGLFCMKFPAKWSKLIDEEREEVENEEASLTRFSTSL